MKPEDRREVEELISQRMDILSAFRDLPPEAREEIARDVGEYVYQRQRALRKPENTYTPRWTQNMEDINEDDGGIERGHTGPTLPRWVDLVGGGAYLDADDAQILHIQPGGGADCMFDYLVSSCFATLPNFTEGQSFTSLSGCTFIGYSTIQGAATAAAALDTSDSSTVFICRGTYAEKVSIVQPNNAALHIVGSGQGNTIIQPGSALSGVALDLNATSSDACIITVTGITVDTTLMSGAGVGIDTDSPGRYRITDCRIVGVSGDTGCTFDTAVVGNYLDRVNFSGAITGAVCGDTSTVIFNQCTFENGVVTGISTTHDARVFVGSCNFYNNTSGVNMTSITRNVIIEDSLFYLCTDGVKVNASITSGYPYSVKISGNLFITCDDGIDFGSLAGDCEGVSINDNTFTDTSTNVGIRLHSTRFKNSIVANNTFSGGPGDSFTSGNEIVDMTQAQATTANTQIVHNTTDSGATLPDTHGSLSASTPWQITDADGNTYVRTEASYGNNDDVIESASGGTIRSRLSALGLQLANGTDLLLYSDAFSTVTADLDATTGQLGLGTTHSASYELSAVHTFTDPAATSGGGFAVAPTMVYTGNNVNAIRGVSLVLNLSGTGTLSSTSNANAFLQTNIANGNTLTVTEVPQVFALAAVGSGSTITNRYGVRINDTTGSGTLTNQYGLYIASMAKGGTLNRAIYSLGGVSVHVGAMRFGSSTAPTNTTDGDLTATRLIVPNATILHSAVTQLGGPVVIPGDGALLFSDNTNYIGLRAPATSPGTDFIYELPDDTPAADQVLSIKSTAGSPVITTQWVDQTGGSGTFNWGKTLVGAAGAFIN